MQKANAALRKSIADGNGLISARDLGIVSDLQTINILNPFSLARRVAHRRARQVHALDRATVIRPGLHRRRAPLRRA